MIAKFLQLKMNNASLMYYQLLSSYHWLLSLLAKMEKDIESPPSWSYATLAERTWLRDKNVILSVH